MNKERKNIAVIEPSDIIYEGLSVSIMKAEHDYTFFRLGDINEIATINSRNELSVVLLNPDLIQNRIHDFVRIKKQSPGIYWIGIIYSLYDKLLLKKFNDTFMVTDDIQVVLRKINKIRGKNASFAENSEELTERETDVLQWLAKGLSNKEISAKLNISIHTVITHRRNIMEKTGIRSLPGLTVYAVSKGIITL